MTEKLSSVEEIKVRSKGLRGTIKESLQDSHTGAIREDDQALIKFHGMYLQDDRDRREERAKKKLDKLYSFMIRLRIPGGVIDADKWLAIHRTSEAYGTGTIKVTTRQTVQLHGLLKHQIQPTIQSFNRADLDSIATCGDINRNVMASNHPQVSPLHSEIHSYAEKISKLLLPKTQAYYEIFIDGEKIYDRSAEVDPLYEDRYLPRKFKIAIAIPPSNDVDVFANDIGLIAIIEKGKFKGFNISAGGGLSSTHGNPDTYPRLGTVIGFCGLDQDPLKVVYEILTVQRDFGNRSDRKRARLKYTIDKMTVDGFKKELEQRIGFRLKPAKPFQFSERGDRYGWEKNHEGLWYYTLFVEHGVENPSLKQFLKKVAEAKVSNFIFTGNQNIILGEVSQKNKSVINKLEAECGINQNVSALRKSSMACVAFPTCPLALAEAQRYLPALVTKIEPLLDKHGLKKEEISIRMTGCPNNCGRSYLSEIGFIGVSPGHYNLMLGGDRYGERIARVYKEKLAENDILETLDGVFGQYVTNRKEGEYFGAYIDRDWAKLKHYGE